MAIDTGSNYGGGSKFHPIKTIKQTIKGIAGLIRHRSDIEYKKQRDANNLANDEAKRDLQYDKMAHQNDLAQKKHVDDLMKNQTKQNQINLDKDKVDKDYDIKNKNAKTSRLQVQADYQKNVNNNAHSDYVNELNKGFTGAKGEGGKGKKPTYPGGGQLNFDYNDFEKQPEPTPQPDEGHPTIHPTPEPDNSDLNEAKPAPQPEQKQPKENPTKDTPQPEPNLNAQETPKKNGVIAKVGNYLKQPKDLRSKFKKIASNLKDKLTIKGRVSKALNPSKHDLEKGMSDEDIAEYNEIHKKHREELGQQNLKQADEEHQKKLAEEKLNKELDEKIARNEAKKKEEASKTTPSDIDIGYNYPQDIEVHTDKQDKPSDIDIAYDDRTTPKPIGVGKNFTADGQSIPRMMKVGYKQPKQSIPRMMKVGYKQPKETTPKDIKLKIDKNDSNPVRKSDEIPKRLTTPKQQSNTADSKRFVANRKLEKGTQDETGYSGINHQKTNKPEVKPQQETPEPTPSSTSNPKYVPPNIREDFQDVTSDNAPAYYNHLNALLNYPSNAVYRALIAEGKTPDKYVDAGGDFKNGIDWGNVDKDINYGDPKERERFDKTLDGLVARALNDPNYKLPPKYRDEIWSNLQRYGPALKEQYQKYAKFWNSLTPEQKEEARKKAERFDKKHNKDMVED